MIILVRHAALMRITCVIGLLISIVGCTVLDTPGPIKQIAVDEAEIFGTVIKAFSLADGSEGKIRKYQDSYSIKLQKYFRVIPISNVTQVNYLSSNLVDGRTLLVLQTSNGSCIKKIQIYAIKGNDVKGWSMGDCLTEPNITYSPDNITFDYAYPTITKRWTYRSDNLYLGELIPKANTLDDATSTSNLGASIGNNSPFGDGVPLKKAASPTANEGASKSLSTSGTKKNVPRSKPKLAQPSPPPTIKFKEKEQKPGIVLILDK